MADVELTELKVQFEKEVTERNVMNQLLHQLARAHPSAIVLMLTRATDRIAKLEDELAALKVDYTALVTTQGQAAIKMDKMREHFNECTRNKNEQLREVCSLTSAMRHLSSIYPPRTDARRSQRAVAEVFHHGIPGRPKHGNRRRNPQLGHDEGK